MSLIRVRLMQSKMGIIYCIPIFFIIFVLVAGCGGDGSGQDLLLGKE